MVRKELWRNIVCSTHINGNILYNLNHSQPSGNPATAILNSMYNSIACRYTFYKRCSYNFNEEVVMIAYGDDNVLSISDTVKDRFNQETMSEDFAEIGMTYTDEEGLRRYVELIERLASGEIKYDDVVQVTGAIREGMEKIKIFALF